MYVCFYPYLDLGKKSIGAYLHIICNTITKIDRNCSGSLLVSENDLLDDCYKHEHSVYNI